jgi:hypothetical protein
MDMSIDVKCAITTAILSVLIYLLLVNLLQRSMGEGDVSVGKEMNQTEWYKSMEVLMLVAVFFAFNLNNYLFTSCKTA